MNKCLISATTFIVLWKREHMLSMNRWNLTPKEEDLSWRLFYVEKTNFSKFKKFCLILGGNMKKTRNIEECVQ